MCLQFENKYGFNSDVFIAGFEDGKLDDDTDFFDWFAAKRGFEYWKKKYQVLPELNGVCRI